MVLYQGMALAGFSPALEFLHLRAPKGRPIPAQANGLGRKRPSITASPEGASPSIKHVSFVVLHLLVLQKPPIFVLETHQPMLFFLPFHIRGHRIHLCRAHRKHPLAVLPMKRLQGSGLSLKPLRGTGLHFLHHVRQR